MCYGKVFEQEVEIKAYHVAEEIVEIELPIADLPELGDRGEEGIVGYILISNGEELTIIANEEEYQNWLETQA